MNEFIIVRIFILSAISFLLAMVSTPLLTHFLYKYRLGKGIRDEASAPIFAKMHQKKAGTPTMGGILIWGTTLFIIILFYLLGKFLPDIFGRFNFLTRSETLLPLGALIA